MQNVEIYHNPRCSKSRQTLELLRAQGVEPKVVEYLKDVPSAEKISELLQALDISAHQLLRTKEAEYKTHNLYPHSDEASIIAAMIESPKLIERPIVTVAGKARIGRPPESVLEIL